MLRYTNNISGGGGGISAKPVDYYRPLTVDVSVEYELPKEVAPPKGSAPLLIIHPSAYFRTKGQQPPPPPSHQQQQVNKSQGGQGGRSTTSRLGDIASTLYYLSTTGLPQQQHHPNQATSSPIQQQQQHQQHINNSKSTNHGRYGPAQTDHPNTATSTSRITRSRTAAKAERNHQPQTGPNCDDYRNRPGLTAQAQYHHHQSMNYGERPQGGAGVIKKAGNPAQALTNHQVHQLTSVDPGLNHNIYDGPIPMDSSSGIFNAPGILTHQQLPTAFSTTSNKLPSGPRGTASNKRLRMMSQQQQHQQPANPVQLYNNNVQNNKNSGGMEPLNLALSPTTQPAYNNQFQSFLGYVPVPIGPYPDRLGSSSWTMATRAQVPVGPYPDRLESSPWTMTGTRAQVPVPIGPYPDRRRQHLVPNGLRGQNPYHHHMSGGVLQSSSHFGEVIARGVLGDLGGKEGPGGGVPVDKGSGSDSGVCSENDSDDVSPPMAAPFSSSSSSHSSSRRSNLSTEFPVSGCYCCCCPSTTSTSSRKSARVKSHHRQQPSNGSNFPTAGVNYGDFFNVISQHHPQVGGSGLAEPLGGSPMDSSGPPHSYHHLQQERKWMGSGTSGLIPGDLGIINGPSYSKWYQV